MNAQIAISDISPRDWLKPLGFNNEVMKVTFKGITMQETNAQTICEYILETVELSSEIGSDKAKLALIKDLAAAGIDGEVLPVGKDNARNWLKGTQDRLDKKGEPTSNDLKGLFEV